VNLEVRQQRSKEREALRGEREVLGCDCLQACRLHGARKEHELARAIVEGADQVEQALRNKTQAGSANVNACTS